MTFDEAYYENDLPRADHSHYLKRAEWILANYGGKRVIELGCGFGQVIKHLRDNGVIAWGVDGSAYAVANTYATGYVFEINAAEHSDIKLQDFVVSWNFLDSLLDEAEAEAVVDRINKSRTNYHVLCMDDGSLDAEAFKAKGYFIKPVEYWLALVDDDVILIDYFSRVAYNFTDQGQLDIPLSWKFKCESVNRV